MKPKTSSLTAGLFDERAPLSFRRVFGDLLCRSERLDTAILRIRLGAVDLTDQEVTNLQRIRLLVAEVSARTLEEEAYALLVDPERRESLRQVFGLLRKGVLEVRSAPLGGWSPDFSVFSNREGGFAVLVGLHWFQRPFPHRGPAWAGCFGPEDARHAVRRFNAIWSEAHDIGPAIHNLLERTTSRRDSVPGQRGPAWQDPKEEGGIAPETRPDGRGEESTGQGDTVEQGARNAVDAGRGLG